MKFNSFKSHIGRKHNANNVVEIEDSMSMVLKRPLLMTAMNGKTVQRSLRMTQTRNLRISAMK